MAEETTNPTTGAAPTASAPAPAREGGYHQNNRGGGGGGGGRGGQRGPRRPRPSEGDGRDGSGLAEKVIHINRSAKVVKGGRRFSFSALVVVGDKQGKVGIGLGKANEVADSIRKGTDDAKRHMVGVSLRDGTIPHAVLSEFCGAQIMLRPASPGTGIIAGKTVRAVLESAGVKDILSKSLGSKNASNVAKATLQGLRMLRLREQIYKSRGLQPRKDKVAVPAAAAN